MISMDPCSSEEHTEMKAYLTLQTQQEVRWNLDKKVLAYHGPARY